MNTMDKDAVVDTLNRILEMHLGEVDRMLRKLGDVASITVGLAG